MLSKILKQTFTLSVGNILHIKSERSLLTHGFAMAFGLGCILRAVQLIVWWPSEKLDKYGVVK